MVMMDIAANMVTMVAAGKWSTVKGLMFIALQNYTWAIKG